MIRTEIHHELNGFIEAIKNNSQGVTVERQSTNMFDRFMNEEDFMKKFGGLVDDSVKEVESAKGYAVNEDQQLAFGLFSAHIRWEKVDQEGGEPAIAGGFAFNEGFAMVMESLHKWKTYYDDFLKYGPEDSEQKELLANLIFFESPAPQFAPYSSTFIGCALHDEASFPHEFYFFDGGIIYPLPFKSYTEYIKTLLANAAIDGWQYFYVDPELLVKKNKGLSYMTTDLRISTRLVEDISPFDHNPSYTIDRLDLIHEYLKRCVKFLPGAFPTLKLDHQGAYLDRLEKLI